MKLFTRVDSSSIRKTIAIYRQEVKTERRSLWMAGIFAPMQDLLYGVLLPLLTSIFAQSLIANPHNIRTPLFLVAGMILTGAAAILVGHLGYVTLFRHEERMTTLLTERAMRGLLAHSHTFFANSKVGSLAGDVNTFARSYLQLLDAAFLQFASIVVSFTLSLIIIAVMAPLMLPVLLLLTALVIYEALYAFQKRSVYRNQRKEMTSKLFGSIADTLGNQTLVRMFGRMEYEVGTAVAQRQEIEKVASHEFTMLQQSADRRFVIMFVFQIITLLFCLFLLSKSLLTVAALIFIITYLGRVGSSLFSIGSVIRTTEQAFLDAAKVTEILNQPIEIVDAPDAKKLEVSRGEITLSHVNFAYQDAKDKAVFKDLNLILPAGQSVGLVGKSGGGKSTLTNLLLRYMDIDSGEISIDGQNIATVTQDSLRSSMSYVPQDPFLFHRTLRDNIAYGRTEATDEQIIDAAKKANAWEFIELLPHGLDTIVGERGVKLSGGQRQRIAIARALLKDAPILVLDEATSALDSESEKLIQASLEMLMKNRTSIVIAHRLSTIAKLDRIIVLDNGKIAEDGTHAELLAEKGVYAKLWAHQSGGFIEE